MADFVAAMARAHERVPQGESTQRSDHYPGCQRGTRLQIRDVPAPGRGVMCPTAAALALIDHHEMTTIAEDRQVSPTNSCNGTDRAWSSPTRRRMSRRGVRLEGGVAVFVGVGDPQLRALGSCGRTHRLSQMLASPNTRHTDVSPRGSNCDCSVVGRLVAPAAAPFCTCPNTPVGDAAPAASPACTP